MSKCLKRALFQTHPNWCRSNHFLVCSPKKIIKLVILINLILTVITAAIAVIAAIESCSIAVDIASVEPVVG